MGFLGVYRAVYDYTPQAENELQISEGDLLYVLEKSDEDDWWKAKKKANSEEEDEPVGLIPNNYVEEAQPIGKARSVYEYTRQTDEELSFPEDAALEVFDSSDPDWILVGRDGDYGFVPSNYIEMSEGDTGDADEEEETAPPPALPARPPAPVEAEQPARPVPEPPSVAPPVQTAATALAAVMSGRSPTSQPPVTLPPRPTQTYEASDDEETPPPALPARAPASPPPAPAPVRQPTQSTVSRDVDEEPRSPGGGRPSRSAGGFHMYNISEMVTVMGKKKKMPMTLGINLGTGTIMLAPERAQDGPTQEWTADRMTHYSREGKHVFLELVRPSKSVDFHAGAKDTAEEIVAALGELAGAVRVTSLKEEFRPGGQKRGQMLYDFMAQGDDEVTVAVGDDVIILDDTLSDEWWKVRRLKNGKEGVVPSSYVEVTSTGAGGSGSTSPTAPPVPSSSKSIVEQNRAEEIRLTKEALRASRDQQSSGSAEVGPGVRLPERGSSLSGRDAGVAASGSQRTKAVRSDNAGGGPQRSSKSKPDPSKVRTWTDRSKSFSVEAQFLGVKDNKINLHKTNGVKIAVPVAKMSLEDLDYVRQITGLALDDGTDTRRKGKSSGDDGGSGSRSTPAAGITVEQPKKPEYDWFQFFLSCDVAVGLCERYAQVFIKDQMDESVLPDVDASVLRTLGLREGDIIKVMRFLDTKYGRTNKNKRNVSFAGEDANGDAEGGGGGGLFTSGPGQTLRNNTRKGRPAPAVQTSDVVDPKAFSQDGDGQSSAKSQPDGKKVSGFDDDAWDVKPSKQAPAAAAQQQAEPAKQAETPAEPATAPLTAGMKELSLLTAPLEPTKAEPPAAPAVTTAASTAPQAATAPAQPLPGATPAFFQSVAQQQIANGQRQRPTPPQLGQSGILAPPPGRSVSAPQVAPSAFAPPPVLQPQMTGIPQFQTQVAPPGQSLQEINQARLQQQYTAQLQQFQPQIPYQVTGAPPALVAMPTGIQQPPYAVNQFGQQVLNGAPGQFIGPLPPQLTGVPGAFTAPGQPPPGGINSVLPPPLEPQRTAFPPFQQQPTGIGPTFNPGGFAGAVPGPLPQNYPPQQLPPPQFQPQQAPAPAAPLVPQKTGPPPPVRFGVTPEAKKLAPQPTGRRANLAHATPQNPFGFDS